MADAFVSQMQTEMLQLREAKTNLEGALSAGQSLADPRKALELANEQYRTASVQIRKHVAKPKAKAGATAAATPTATEWDFG